MTRNPARSQRRWRLWIGSWQASSRAGIDIRSVTPRLAWALKV
jgi:hypothetical protein